MRQRLGRLAAAAPADTWFFLSVSAFALALTVLYWFWTYEWAGTILLFGFSMATGLMGLRLLLGRPPRRSPDERVADDRSRGEAVDDRSIGEAAEASADRPPTTGAEGSPGGPEVVATAPPIVLAPASPDPDRPFLDEGGRLPAPTIAPLAIAFAAALVVTSIVLGPWLVIAAVLPLAWGAISWIRDAGAEFRAIDPGSSPRQDVSAAARDPSARSASAMAIPEVPGPGPGGDPPGGP